MMKKLLALAVMFMAVGTNFTAATEAYDVPAVAPEGQEYDVPMVPAEEELPVGDAEMVDPLTEVAEQSN